MYFICFQNKECLFIQAALTDLSTITAWKWIFKHYLYLDHIFYTIGLQIMIALCDSCPLPPRKLPGTHFCWRLSRTEGRIAAENIRSIEKSNDLIRSRTRSLLYCSIVPRPMHFRVPTTI
jgi:hypothetical protein